MIPSISPRWHDVYHANLLNALCAPDRELINHTFMVTDPLDRSVDSINRNFNERFSHTMFRWTLEGSFVITPDMISMNPNAANYETVYSPIGRPFNCVAYGPRIKEQLPHVLEILRMTGGTTRRAEIMILKPEDIHAGIARERKETKCEYPCTMGFNFRVRDGKLDMITTMRSNNYTTTVNQDFFVFTLLMEHIATLLDVPVGTYYHSVQSAHVLPGEEARAIAIVGEYIEETPMQESTKTQWEMALADATANVS